MVVLAVVTVVGGGGGRGPFRMPTREEGNILAAMD